MRLRVNSSGHFAFMQDLTLILLVYFCQSCALEFSFCILCIVQFYITSFVTWRRDFKLFKIFGTVHPVIQVPNQLVGAPLGTDVTVECYVESSPKSINYWVRDSSKHF